jgi:hypothetical protein
MARAVGLAAWEPNAESADLIRHVNQILREFRSSLPLTGRQVFYRLVATTGYDKTEKSYKALLEKLNRARRAGFIPFSSIRDDGTTISSPFGFSSEGHFYGSVASMAENFELDRSLNQDTIVEVWVEAAGMVPQVARVCEPYGVAVYSSGGFNSTTMKHSSSQRFVDRWRDRMGTWAGDWPPTVVFHIGDHDPSGVAIFTNLQKDTHAFVEDIIVEDLGGGFDDITGDSVVEWERLAVTPRQAADMNLLSAPPKASDSRSVNWHGETYQAEAIDPDDLATIVRGAVESVIDLEEWERTKAQEEAIRGRLVDWVAEVME